jgi:ABC-type bacteriocin/lantibiotic exporter with double-glycine peptidase domain
VKAGGQETALFLKWIGLQVQYVNASIRTQRYLLTLGQAPAILGLVAHLAVLGLGAVMIMRGGFTVGDLVAFQVLLAGFTAPVHALFSHTQKLQTLRGDLARLDDVLHHAAEEDIDVNATAKGIPSPPIAGNVEFRNVTFGYNRGEAPLIEDFSLTVKAGGRVALVGASGSGKSTVAKLAAGLYKPWSGEILFDGRPRVAYDRSHLADAVAYVDQDVTLFEGSVRDNLTLWQEAADDTLRGALRDAAIESDILMRQGGLDAPLQEGARNLSGGQRQRLEIARALVRGPRVLILDEATSALDPASEAMVEQRLRARHLTCLVVAHRLSTVRDADEIIVLDGGRVAERGTYAELKGAGGRFAELVATESVATADV